MAFSATVFLEIICAQGAVAPSINNVVARSRVLQNIPIMMVEGEWPDGPKLRTAIGAAAKSAGWFKGTTRGDHATLLVKGREYDHAVILDADSLNARDLYVVMTRGAKSLTIIGTGFHLSD